MSGQLLAANEAASRLDITVTTFYEWLGLSDLGLFMIRGQNVSVRYYQGGRQGQGRIRIEEEEVERLKELMRVRPQPIPQRRLRLRNQEYPGINVRLGRPSTFGQ